MKHHGPAHADAVIGGGFLKRIGRYRFASDWLEAQLKRRKDFPYIVAVT